MVDFCCISPWLIVQRHCRWCVYPKKLLVHGWIMIAGKFADCPFEGRASQLKNHLNNGGEADVIITDSRMDVMMHSGHGSTGFSGNW